MFRGRSIHTLDNKGRVAIPARFRDVLKVMADSRLVVTNLDECLVAYPYEEWRQVESEVVELSRVKPEVRAFMRFFISGATECTCDKQGRVLIPPALREFAGFEDQLVLAGMLSNFEIWAKDRFDSEMERSRKDFTGISQALADLGL